ncbi:hypothetical protein M9458_026027, partial [Cirrhinus mrigala]
VPLLLDWMQVWFITPSRRWASAGSLMIFWLFPQPSRTCLKIPPRFSLTIVF